MENHTVVVAKGIIIHNQKVLIIKRADDDVFDPGFWETVGGKIEFGEELEDALIREVREEAGLTVTVERLLYATTFMDGNRQVVVLVYACSATDDRVTLSFEHQDYMWADEAQMRQRIGRSILEDMNRYAAWGHIFPA